jgi:rhodanese-related sulfurtransferase
MPIKQVEPWQAHEILKTNPEAVYLDVRTEEEFANGHPEGAVNIPVVFSRGPGQFEVNAEFLLVAEKIFPKDTTLVVGCMAGQRSQRACEMLEQVAYAKLTNVRGGFGGARNAGGQIVVKGWRDSGLPVSSEVDQKNSYQALRKKAGV